MIERETMAGFLLAGDRVRYLGEWLDIERARYGVRAIPDVRGIPQFARFIYLDCLDDAGKERMVFFAQDQFVAADTRQRTPGEQVPGERTPQLAANR